MRKLWRLAAAALGVAIATGASFAAGAEVKGTLTGDGKPATLAFVSTHKGPTLEDKQTVMLVFTEKDHSKEKTPQMKASLGNFGSAIIITIFPDNGKIVGCEVAHTAHQMKPFSSLGSLDMTNFKNDAGQLSGRIATTSKVETFKQAWEVDLTFQAKAP